MNYHFANNIGHPEKIVEDKVNYFADRFQFTLINLCRPGFDELESHKSLLEKIRTQIDHNDFGLSKKFIEHYMRNALLEKNNFIVKNFYEEEFREMRKFWREYDNSSNEKSLDNKSFAEKIEQLIFHLDQSLFENCLNSVINAFLCKHPLNGHDHIKIIDSCVPVLVSELKFSGLSDGELDRLFRVIFAKEIRLNGKRVNTEAPLPPDLSELKRNPNSNPDEVHDAIQAYLNDMGIRNQFWGLYHIYKNSNLDRTFLFKIKEMKSSEKIELNYDGVLFSNQLKNEYVTSKSIRKEYCDFFEKGIVMAQTTVTTNSFQTGKQKAIQKIQEALFYFNAIFKEDARVEVGDYIIRDLDRNNRFTSFPKMIDTRGIEKFEDGSLFKFFGEQRNELINRVIELDKIYFKAVYSPLPEEQIVLFWTYLDSFFSTNEKDQTKIKNISAIAKTEWIFDIQMDHYKMVFKVLYNMRLNSMTVPEVGRGNEEQKLTKAELNKYLNIRKLDDFPFEELKSKLNHPYLFEHLSWFNESTYEKKITRASEHFGKMLFEAYEQRNLLVHGGTHNEKAVAKVLIILPDIVSCFRRRVLDVLKKRDFITLSQALESLKE
jgi:hypothetical protein